MLTRAELLGISRARLKDAEALLKMQRYDGAVYLCGYAVELALKARICRTLRWAGYPSTRGEFQDLQTLRTHDLDLLLRLTGVEAKIRSKLVSEWSDVAAWDPEARYKPVGNATLQSATLMIESAKKVIGGL